MAAKDDKCNVERIGECSICMERFVKPKCLPCMHTFCLKCLQKYANEHSLFSEKNGGKKQRKKSDGNAGDELACPMCRQIFKIPFGGFEALPDNIFFEQMLQINKGSVVESLSTEVDLCDICSRNQAAQFCVECDQNLCDECSIYHGKSRASKYHSVLPLVEKQTSQVLMQSRGTFCDEHKGDLLRLYCYDCSLAICLMCAVFGHETHHRVELSVSSKTFSDQLQESFPKLSNCIAANQSELRSLNENEESFLQQIAAREREVVETADEIKRLVDSESSQLLNKLTTFRSERVKAIQTRKDDIDRQNTMIESFKSHAEELIMKGSLCHISQSAKGLLSKTDNLLTAQDEFQKQTLSADRVTFVQEKLTEIMGDRFKFVGWILFNDDDSRASKPNRAELESSMNDAKKDVTRLTEELIALQTTLDNLEQRSSEMDTKMASLNENLIAVSKEKERLKENLIAVNKEKERLKENLIAVNKEKERLKENLIAANKEKERLKENVIAANKEKERLKEKLCQCDTESVLVAVGLNDEVTCAQQTCYISLERLDKVNVVNSTPAWIGAEAAACVIGNTLYAVGIGQNCEQLWKWNATSDWRRCKDMASYKRCHCVAVVDSTLFALGGWDEITSLSSIEAYNTLTNKWSAANQLAHAVSCAACLAYKNSIYVFGGNNEDGKYVAHVQKYDTATQTCCVMANPMPCAAALMRAVLWKTSAILVGNTTCFIYNLESQVWQERRNFKANFVHFGLVVDNGTLYIAGGGMNTSDENNKTIWTCTDEIKSVSVRDVIEDKPAVWKHHAKLLQPTMIHAFCTLPLTFQRSTSSA